MSMYILGGERQCDCVIFVEGKTISIGYAQQPVQAKGSLFVQVENGSQNEARPNENVGSCRLSVNSPWNWDAPSLPLRIHLSIPHPPLIDGSFILELPYLPLLAKRKSWLTHLQLRPTANVISLPVSQLWKILTLSRNHSPFNCSALSYCLSTVTA